MYSKIQFVFNNNTISVGWNLNDSTTSLLPNITDAWLILCTNKIYTYVLKKSYFILPITKGSVNALMKLAGFSTSIQ